MVLYEIAVRDLPYAEQSSQSKKNGKGMSRKFMREIAEGKRQPDLNGKARVCRRYGVGHAFKKLLNHCVKFEPRDRPDMEDVVSRLEEILEKAEAAALGSAPSYKGISPRVVYKSEGVANPWAPGSKVYTCFETFASRLEDPEQKSKLDELHHGVEKSLGATAVAPATGVFNAAKLYRFLCTNEYDVADAMSMVILNANSRLEYKMDAKRERIVREDLSFSTLPRIPELLRYQPFNPFLCKAKGGDIVDYYCLGGAADFSALKGSFSVDEYCECVLYLNELRRE